MWLSERNTASRGRSCEPATRLRIDARGYVSPYFKEPDTFTLTAGNAPAPWQDLRVDDPLPRAAGEMA